MSRVYEFPPRPELRPPHIEGARILGVQLRRLNCHYEWRANLNAYLAVVPETAVCPRYSAKKPKPPAAA